VNPIGYLSQIDTVNKFYKIRIEGTFTSGSITSVIISFSDVPAGNYTLSLYYEEYGFAYIQNSTLKTITILLTNLNLPSAISSIYGGQTLSLTGVGFPDMTNSSINNITICDSLVEIVSNTTNKIDFNIPKLLTKNFVSTYNLKSSESMQQKDFSVTSDNPARQNLAKDGFVSTFYDSSNSKCYLLFDFGSFQIIFQEIQFYLNLAKPIGDYFGLLFEFSNDLSAFTPLYTVDNNIKTGWNKISVSPDIIPYRYVRFIDPSGSKSRCNLAEIKFFGVKIYSKYNDNPLTDTLACSVLVNINGKKYGFPDAIQYKASILPKIISISPILGPSSGKTDVTILGEGLGTTIDAVDVKIDRVPCTVKAVTDKNIVCTTGARTLFVPPSFVVRIGGNVALAKNLTFSYIDRWSDPNTWGGESPPKEFNLIYNSFFLFF
jgi:hypothetical protein